MYRVLLGPNSFDVFSLYLCKFLGLSLICDQVFVLYLPWRLLCLWAYLDQLPQVFCLCRLWALSINRPCLHSSYLWRAVFKSRVVLIKMTTLSCNLSRLVFIVKRAPTLLVRHSWYNVRWLSTLERIRVVVLSVTGHMLSWLCLSVAEQLLWITRAGYRKIIGSFFLVRGGLTWIWNHKGGRGCDFVHV